MALGLGHLIDLNRKLKNNKNLLSAKSAKSRLKNRVKDGNLNGKLNSEQFNKVTDEELQVIKSEIRGKLRRESRNELIYSIVSVCLILAVCLLLWFLL